MPDTSGSVDLGSLSQEEREAVNRLAEGVPEGEDPGPEPQRRASIAFTVVVENGNVMVGPYEGDFFFVENEITDDAVYGACAVVLKDITAKETAAHTLNLQMQQAAMMQKQMQDAQIAARLQQGGIRG